VVHAVIETGGKQFRVTEGQVVRVPALRADVKSTIELPALAVTDGETVKIGTAVVEGARVICTVLEHGKGRKILVFKFKRRKQYRRTRGHRQKYTALRVEKIMFKESGDGS